MKTKITASGGKGRPCNPYSEYPVTEFTEGPFDYDNFERTAITAPTFLNNQPFMDEYEGEAELVWQYLQDGEWKTIVEPKPAIDHLKWSTRQAWELLPPSQPVNLASGEQREFKKLGNLTVEVEYFGEAGYIAYVKQHRGLLVQADSVEECLRELSTSIEALLSINH